MEEVRYVFSNHQRFVDKFIKTVDSYEVDEDFGRLKLDAPPVPLL